MTWLLLTQKNRHFGEALTSSLVDSLDRSTELQQMCLSNRKQLVSLFHHLIDLRACSCKNLWYIQLPRTADMMMSSSLGVGRVAESKITLQFLACYEALHAVLGRILCTAYWDVHDYYFFWSNIITVIQSRIIKLVGVAIHMGEMRNGQCEVIHSGDRCRWGNTKTASKEIWYESVFWIQLIHYRIPR